MIMTLMGSINCIGLDQRQAQQVQFKANKKTEAEQLQAKTVSDVRISTPRISMGKAPMDIRLFHIHQAADGGILRPVLLEMMDMLDMNPDMPRMRDLIRQAEEIKCADSARVVDLLE